jgi:hypothetical protein
VKWRDSPAKIKPLMWIKWGFFGRDCYAIHLFTGNKNVYADSQLLMIS